MGENDDIARTIDLRDIGSLSRILTQVYFFTEYANFSCAVVLRRSADNAPPLDPVLAGLETKVLRERDVWDRSPCVGLVLARHAGMQPTADPAIICPLVARLRGAGRQLKHGSPIGWRLAKLTESDYHYDVGGSIDFATRPMPSSSSAKMDVSSAQTRRYCYWDELFDPVATAHDFLVHCLSVQESVAPHYVQRWLRHECHIKFDRDKYALKDIAARFNNIFFGDEFPSKQHLHSVRPPTIGLRLLVDDLRIVLQSHYDKQLRPEQSSGYDSNPGRAAMGIYLFLRFSRVLRGRFRWEDQPPLAARTQVEEGVSALRPLEYTYLETKMFGAMSAIRGLNSVFRGGILPKAHGGRTFVVRGKPGAGKSVFALHMMADLASRGRFAIYFSFEETANDIFDRLWKYGLIDQERFAVALVGAELENAIRAARAADPKKGLLVLYGREKSDKFDLLPEVEAVVHGIEVAMRETPGNDWRWRALTLDSINALEFGSRSGPHRFTIQHLVDVIERKGFWGLIVSEDQDESFASLPYLADTVVNLGFGTGRHVRTLEVEKCRTQNYQPGPHAFRITEGRGIVIYPSLRAVQSSLRRRVPSTLSEQWMIPLPGSLPQSLQLEGLEEKTATLLWGPANSGKTLLLVHLATAPSRRCVRANDGVSESGHPDTLPSSGSLLVSFQTWEAKFVQTLRRYPALKKRWESAQVRLRWYSHGDNITSGQVIAEIWQTLQKARRAGVPIDRVMFHGVNAAEELLPNLNEALFWPTLLDLLATEAVTSFFVADGEDGRTGVIEKLRGGVDYAMHTYRQGDLPSSCIRIEKRPSFRLQQQAEFNIDATGAVF